MNNSRYNRQLRLSGFGKEAQEKLGAARVLVVGLGGLGVPVVQYLNAMGVGTLGLVDHDLVEITNLHRQVLYTESDLGKLKVDAAAALLKKQNSLTTIHTFPEYLDYKKALTLFKDYDVVVDASDNFETRYAINDASVQLEKPVVYGALHGFEGQITVFNYRGGPTYRCLFPEPPAPDQIPDCNTHGVLGVLPGIVGTLQALETVKICTGTGEVSSGRMVLFNGLNMEFYDFGFRRNPSSQSVEGRKAQRETISFTQFKDAIEKEKLQLIDVRSPEEFKDYHLQGSVNIPLDALEEKQEKINFHKPVYLICESGTRSAVAQARLAALRPESRIIDVLGGVSKMRSVCY